MSKPTASIDMGNAASPVQSDTSAPKTSCLAITSMVLSIVGFFLLGNVLGPLAIILGAIAIHRINEKPHELVGHGMAKAGIICGVIAIVVYILAIA